MKDAVFWALITLTLIFIAIDMTSFKLLELIIITVFFDFLVLVLMIFDRKKEPDNIQYYMSLKLESIEKLCDQMLKKAFNPETEKRLETEDKEIIKWLENF